MSDAVTVAIIALVGQVIIALVSNSGLISKLEKQSEVADTKLRGELDVMKSEVSTLRQEVQKHNGMIERTYKLEERVSLNEQRLDALEHRQTL
jgi:uncharacterized membrane-anchored protein YhcB (DUF1043 family)